MPILGGYDTNEKEMFNPYHGKVWPRLQTAVGIPVLDKGRAIREKESRCGILEKMKIVNCIVLTLRAFGPRLSMIIELRKGAAVNNDRCNNRTIVQISILLCPIKKLRERVLLDHHVARLETKAIRQEIHLATERRGANIHVPLRFSPMAQTYAQLCYPPA